MDTLEFHELANIFPLMTDEEVNDLGEDMLKHGQREPIWTYEGKILDGRNRYNACLLKGIEPRSVEFRGADPLAFVVSANLYRRQLNAGQRALVFETLANLPHGGDRRSEQAAKIAACSQAAVAKLGKVSPRTMSTAKALKRDAIPAVVDAVKCGKVPIAHAAAFAQQERPLDQARLIAEHGSPADAVKATVKAKADRAATKMPRPVADPKRAADRADVYVQVGDWVELSTELTQTHVEQLNAWLMTKPKLPDDAVATLADALLLCAESFERVGRAVQAKGEKLAQGQGRAVRRSTP
jgi:hypothetical protein